MTYLPSDIGSNASQGGLHSSSVASGGSHRMTPRQEKTRLVLKILAFLSDRGYYNPITANELSQPTKQVVHSVWQFLLRQIDASINLPTTGLEDIVICYYVTFGYREKLCKSVLRSFNSPPSWQQTLCVQEVLIDQLKASDEGPMLPVPTVDAPKEIPSDIANALVPSDLLNYGDRERTELLEDLGEQYWLDHHLHLFMEGLLCDDEPENAYLTRLQHRGTLEMRPPTNLAPMLAELEQEVAALEASHACLIEEREQVAKYSKDYHQLDTQAGEVKLSEAKITTDHETYQQRVGDIVRDREATLKKRRAIESRLSSQECNREQVIHLQREIESLKVELGQNRSARARLRQDTMLITEEKSATLKSLEESTRELKNDLQQAFIQDDDNSLESNFDWQGYIEELGVNTEAALEALNAQSEHTDDAVIRDALSNVPLDDLLREALEVIEKDENAQASAMQAISEHNMLFEKLQSIRDDWRQKGQMNLQTRSKISDSKQAQEAEVETDIENLHERLKSIEAATQSIDPSLYAQLAEAQAVIQRHEDAVMRVRDRHQSRLNECSELIKKAKYQYNRRLDRLESDYLHGLTSLKTLILDPLSYSLCDGRLHDILFRPAEERAISELSRSGLPIPRRPQ